MTQAPTNETATPNPQGNEAQQKIIEAAIGEISHIATLPEITLRIIRLVEDPNSSAKDLTQVITNDPALGARILKVVNSAFYGLPGQIGSINRAIVLLGLNAVKNIAIAASLAKLFRGGQISDQFNARDLWTHSIAVATATHQLADHVGLGLPDEAFLAGLIHDLGIMVEIQSRRPQFVEALERVKQDESLPLRKAETEVIGASHEQFGAALCSAWKFPQCFAYAAGFHHRPTEVAEANRVLPSLVFVADICAARAGMGWSGDLETQEIPSAILEQLNLTQQKVEEVVEALPQAMEEAQAIFGQAAA